MGGGFGAALYENWLLVTILIAISGLPIVAGLKN